jgi:hypothetical protein
MRSQLNQTTAIEVLLGAFWNQMHCPVDHHAHWRTILSGLAFVCSTENNRGHFDIANPDARDVEASEDSSA